jgi:hypothetical protein
MTIDNPAAVPDVPVYPLPLKWQFQNVVFEGEPRVLAILTSPAGQSAFWFDGAAAVAFGEGMIVHGKQAQTDLVVPKPTLLVPGQ